ncbi:pyrroloquinoline quinone biosynthesis protein [Cyanobium sp. LEGE 06143]|uniref:Coq4 family protein n=1 Tax=Cyanobium sp. LEGE 06143 TaxID=945727 RepID=UPI00187ECEFF|nr:Coq4 family protein [Cyanobium sp. LEGE 06143]MBE9173581.1 pyrroloquinoline quinone biosynthesis protein [Cyanobium sp. LEGE 06143]
MSFRYLDRVASAESIQQFLDLADLAVGAGQSADNVFMLSHRLRASRPMQLCLSRLQRDPASWAWVEQRRPISPYNLEALRAMPKGSLGHTYGTVMATLGYDINFFPEPAFFNNLESDADYINYRVYATHDIHHIVTGFSLDNYGELGVISASVAQFSHPGLAFTDLIALLTSWFRTDTPIDELDNPREQARTTAYVFRMISRGLELGLEAQPLFPVNWPERLEQNLEELRKELGIEAARDGLFSWHSDPALAAALAA